MERDHLLLDSGSGQRTEQVTIVIRTSYKTIIDEERASRYLLVIFEKAEGTKRTLLNIRILTGNSQNYLSISCSKVSYTNISVL